jgi:uncharacterized protein YutE (UPF0331/DUF86 family)
MDNKLVAKKVKYFKKCIIELTNFTKLNKTTFCENSKNVAAAQTYMYSAIQTAVFLGVHTLQKNNLASGSNYYEVFEILSKNGRLDSKNLSSYAKLLEFRNKLMFEYDEITDEMMYNMILDGLPILVIFLKDIHRRG